MPATDKSPRFHKAIAGICALVAGGLGWIYLNHLENTYQDMVERVGVLTARRYIPPSTPLHRGLFQKVKIPKPYIAPGAVSDFDLLESSGHPTFRNTLAIPEGLQLAERDLVSLLRSDALSQVIGENRTAVSFGVDNVRGLGGNLKPGDVVDVLQTTKPGELSSEMPRTSLLFQAVPLIAIGKDWNLDRIPQETPSHLNEPLTEPEEPDVYVLTVLLNPVAALRLAQARESTVLSVILRAPHDVPSTEPAP